MKAQVRGRTTDGSKCKVRIRFYYPVIAAGSVFICDGGWSDGHPEIVLNVEVEYSGCDGLGTGDAAVLVRVEGVVVCRVADCSSSHGDFKEGLPIAFLYVDYSEAVDFLIPRFFLDHKIVNSEPAIQRGACGDA